jgi:hypothetical protein
MYTIKDLLEKYPDSGLAREATEETSAVYVVTGEGFETYVKEDDQDSIDALMHPRPDPSDGPAENKTEPGA